MLGLALTVMLVVSSGLFGRALNPTHPMVQECREIRHRDPICIIFHLHRGPTTAQGEFGGANRLTVSFLATQQES